METPKTLFLKNADFFVSTDTEELLQSAHPAAIRAEGCYFALCLAGECTFHIHLGSHKVVENDMVCILPKTFFQVTEWSDDCRLCVVGFHNHIIDTTEFITSSMSYLSALLDMPIVHLRKEYSELYCDYFQLLKRMSALPDFKPSTEIANHQLFSILQGIIHIHRHSVSALSVPGNRAEEIIRTLIQQVMLHYTRQRSVSFYADLLHISPQHLSTTVNKVTGRTVTDIIARLVVNDAQAKLKSTNQSIQEIAYSLNFTDLSFFGKYFKRYTGMSPKAYRES